MQSPVPLRRTPCGAQSVSRLYSTARDDAAGEAFDKVARAIGLHASGNGKFIQSRLFHSTNGMLHQHIYDRLQERGCHVCLGKMLPLHPACVRERKPYEEQCAETDDDVERKTVNLVCASGCGTVHKNIAFLSRPMQLVCGRLQGICHGKATLPSAGNDGIHFAEPIFLPDRNRLWSIQTPRECFPMPLPECSRRELPMLPLPEENMISASAV